MGVDARAQMTHALGICAFYLATFPTILSDNFGISVFWVQCTLFQKSNFHPSIEFWLALKKLNIFGVQCVPTSLGHYIFLFFLLHFATH